MTDEAAAIERSDEPVTVERLVDDLRTLGVAAGETVVVHSSLSALGWVVGGPPAVVDALLEALAPDGTLVMPTHSTQYTDPTDWENPPVPDDWMDTIRRSRPPYRPAITPTRGMGAIPECFRTYPETLRSRHPTYSFAAWGANAEEIVADHGFDHGLGESSPLARVYDREGWVLLLGVGHDSDTSLHLAEHRADYEKTVMTQDAPVLVDGERKRIEFAELDYDDADFEDAGAAFERDCPNDLARGRVGYANATLLDQRALVDYVSEWLGENRA
ncbi:aminoglycoside N(3)-acetyltransferase [Halorussus amylolyticus]|uniref:aminoglycoside N(3)-acetyltransferase n=1 Tax=Halorussus amylolyticus TaxID=1126242 RepID=UPI00105353E5|nr:AAC(3) family N-acetyltransferase [Halorussus amylolyticus]